MTGKPNHQKLKNRLGRLELDAAARESEFIFRSMAETIEDVFWLSTCGVGEMIYVSPAYEWLWERSRESLYQSPMSFLEAIHPEDIDRLIEMVATCHRRGKPYECEYRIIRKDGEIRWIHERGFPVTEPLNGIKLMTGLCTDITQFKKTEQTLIQNEKRYRLVVEDQTEIISRFTPDGTFIFVNEIYCHFFRKTEKELIGKKWHPVAHEDDIPMINRKLKEMSPMNPVVLIENRVWDAGGRLRWMQFVNRGFYDDQGRLAEIQSVGRDITDLKKKETLIIQQEQALRRKNEELEKINTALEVVLEQRNKHSQAFKENIYKNFNQLIMPDLSELQHHLKFESDQKKVALIMANINNILYSDTDGLQVEQYNLTRTELKITHMIRNEMTSLEIAEHLHISPNTVAFHRKNLRRKFGLIHSNASLAQYLKLHI